MNPISTHVELTQDEIVARLSQGAMERLDMSAADMVAAFRDGSLEDPGSVLDLLGLAAMLDTDHPLYVEL